MTYLKICDDKKAGHGFSEFKFSNYIQQLSATKKFDLTEICFRSSAMTDTRQLNVSHLISSISLRKCGKICSRKWRCLVSMIYATEVLQLLSDGKYAVPTCDSLDYNIISFHHSFGLSGMKLFCDYFFSSQFIKIRVSTLQSMKTFHPGRLWPFITFFPGIRCPTGHWTRSDHVDYRESTQSGSQCGISWLSTHTRGKVHGKSDIHCTAVLLFSINASRNYKIPIKIH